MKSRYLKMLVDLHTAAAKDRFPNLPAHAIPKPKYKVGDTNGLTEAIKAFTGFLGGYLMRVNTQGQWDSKLGRWRKSGSTPGALDLMGVGPGGGFLAVEVKRGRDKVRDSQRKVIDRITAAGGAAFVARDFDSFCDWFLTYYEGPGNE